MWKGLDKGVEREGRLEYLSFPRILRRLRTISYLDLFIINEWVMLARNVFEPVTLIQMWMKCFLFKNKIPYLDYFISLISGYEI